MPSSSNKTLAPVRFITTVLDAIPSRIEKHWSAAVRFGWYPNAESDIAFGKELLANSADLDKFMVEQIQLDWNTLTKSLSLSYPHRQHILECAFDLHESGRFIASVPLFLAQADGIVAERIGSHFFTDHESRDEKILLKLAEENRISAAILRLLIPRTQFQAGISKSSLRKKELAPNRNGILHGAKRHLDYGTQMNSFKAFSLLAFVAFVFRAAPR